MSEIRHDVIDDLVTATLDTLRFVCEMRDASESELMSAVMTLTLRMIAGATKMGANPEPIRDSLAQLYALLPPIEPQRIN